MKRHLILFLALLVATCVRSNEVTPTVSRTPVSLSPTLTAVAEEGERWAIYSPDPKHLWNRMFRQFFKRSTTDGTEYGWDSLDPLRLRKPTRLYAGGKDPKAVFGLSR
jgi:hypothetical protein